MLEEEVKGSTSMEVWKSSKQQAELARLRARIQMDKANIVQEAIKVDHNESTADNLSFVLREFYHDSIREGVLNGSIPSGIADSGTTATCGTVRDAKHFLHTGETSDNQCTSKLSSTQATAKAWNNQ